MHTGARLRQAAAEGHLTGAELDEGAGAAYEAHFEQEFADLMMPAAMVVPSVLYGGSLRSWGPSMGRRGLDEAETVIRGRARPVGRR